MATVSPVSLELDAAEARRMMLRAQGLLGAADRRAGVPGMLRRLGAVQLDTISVLARSHELVAYARLGAVGRKAVEKAYWDGASAFEYWSHAACVLPMELWPHFGHRRRAFAAKGFRWHRLDAAGAKKVLDEVRAKLRAEGPLTVGELGGAKNGGEWFDWSETKIAVEWLLDLGEVVCTRRTGWRRVYDLAERAIPEELRARAERTGSEEGARALVARAGQALAVATAGDLARHLMLPRQMVDGVVAESGLERVRVEGWGEAWADPAALAAGPAEGRCRTVLLSPFDSLLWDRRRAARVFGVEHRLEAYVPKAKRVYGYFAMPVLSGGRLVGWVDPGREGETLVAKRVTLRSRGAEKAVGVALREAARWVGCGDVRTEVTVGP
ncbi:cytoplasmic protein [Mangrovactinospora gilvigrisea]|uniref:Cytoplasmic protein n=1 Tax=Mangrovactinospora gilvigrisea TaxID=1428644 RepID=A0A1J7C7R4_9ACTN|nr:crosslink repair DNA glycosylase YcaQ family protein [Mangrovactinospora gilvigrisea]OIV37572.1 cytoplasmic protein [Mangrovactinospora gilvigrisea]